MKTLLTRLLVGLLLVPTFIWQVKAQDKEPKIVSTDPNEKKDPLITEAEELYRKGEVDRVGIRR